MQKRNKFTACQAEKFASPPRVSCSECLTEKDRNIVGRSHQALGAVRLECILFVVLARYGAFHEVCGSLEPHINREQGFKTAYEAVPAIVGVCH